jgi:uncharacterized membrane protein YgcG
MRVLGRFMTIVVLSIIASFTLVGAASAAPSGSYLDHVGSTLRTGHHRLFVDDAAKPTLSPSQQDALESQMDSTGKPIFVVLVDNAQANMANGPTELLDGLYNSIGLHAAVIAVSSSKGFFAKGYNVPRSVADGAPSLARQFFDKGESPSQTYSDWVNAVVSIPASGKTASSTQVEDPGMPLWLKVVFGLLALLALGAIVFFIFRRKQEREDDEQRKERLQRHADQLFDERNRLYTSAELSTEVKQHWDVAAAYIQYAYQALDSDDLDDAEWNLREAERKLQHARDAEARESGSQEQYGPRSATEHGFERAAATSHVSSNTSAGAPGASSSTDQRGKASKFRDPNTNRTVIVNNYPQQQYSSAYPYQWGGGMIGGSYFGPGYYNNPLGDLGEILLIDAMLDGGFDNNGDFQDGYSEGYEDAERDEQSDSDQGQGDQSDTSDEGNFDLQDDGSADEGFGSFQPDDGTSTASDDGYGSFDTDPQSDASASDDQGFGSFSDSAPASDPVYSGDTSGWGSDSGSSGGDYGGYDSGGSDFGGGDSGGGDGW